MTHRRADIFIYRALADASTNMNTEMNADELVLHVNRLREPDTMTKDPLQEDPLQGDHLEYLSVMTPTVLEAEFNQLGAVHSVQ